MPEAGVLTINDLLNNKTQLAGRAQESLAAQKVKSEKLSAQGGSAWGRKAENPKSNVALTNFRDIPANTRMAESAPKTNYQIPDTKDQQAAGASLREQVLQAKQAEAKKKAKEGEGMAAAEETAGVKKWSARALALAFWFLPTIIFFVPAILYIDVHILLRWILGEKFFCKLGEEAGLTKIATVADKIIGDASKEFRRIFDIIVALLSNVVLFSAVFTFFGIIAVITGSGPGSWTFSGITGTGSLVTGLGAGAVYLWGGPVGWIAALWSISNWLGWTSTGAGIFGY